MHPALLRSEQCPECAPANTQSCTLVQIAHRAREFCLPPACTPVSLQDLCGFNRFFMDKEEDAVIKLQALADRIQGAQGGSEELQELKAALVDFHGEMVLLLHWSLLNYAAVVKILKKHGEQRGSWHGKSYGGHLSSWQQTCREHNSSSTRLAGVGPAAAAGRLRPLLAGSAVPCSMTASHPQPVALGLRPMPDACPVLPHCCLCRQAVRAAAESTLPGQRPAAGKLAAGTLMGGRYYRRLLQCHSSSAGVCPVSRLPSKHRVVQHVPQHGSVTAASASPVTAFPSLSQERCQTWSLCLAGWLMLLAHVFVAAALLLHQHHEQAGQDGRGSHRVPRGTGSQG